MELLFLVSLRYRTFFLAVNSFSFYREYMKIKELIQHLNKRGLTTSSARATFHNYLKNFCDAEDSFSNDHLDSFYDRTMMFTHWRQKKQELGEMIAADLNSLQGAGIEGSLHGNQIQWLEIEQDRDFKELIDKENQILQKRAEEIRVLNHDNGVLRIRRGQKGGVRVEVKSRLGFIEGHQVHLARPLTILNYTADLELRENADQILQLSPLVVAKFQVQDEMIQGMTLQGVTYARAGSLVGHLEDAPELFYNLKKLERAFINPHTDPHYMATVSQLERAIQLVRTNHPDARMIADEILRKAERFAQEVFTNDRRLIELISTLKYACPYGMENNQQSGSQVVTWQNHRRPDKPVSSV